MLFSITFPLFLENSVESSSLEQMKTLSYHKTGVVIGRLGYLRTAEQNCLWCIIHQRIQILAWDCDYVSCEADVSYWSQGEFQTQ